MTVKIAELSPVKAIGPRLRQVAYVPYAPPGAARLVHGFQQVALHESGRILAQFDPRGEGDGVEDYHDYLRRVGWGGYSRAHGIGNNDIHPAPSPLPAEHTCDAWVCSAAIRFLEGHRRAAAENPFFLFMSFAKPHAPYDPPRPYDALYDPRQVPAPFVARETAGPPRTPTKHEEGRTHGWDLWSPECHRVARAHYYGLVTFQDEQIGRMLAWLEGQGWLENTVVVYTADHGDLLGDFFLRQELLTKAASRSAHRPLAVVAAKGWCAGPGRSAGSPADAGQSRRHPAATGGGRAGPRSAAAR